MNDPLLEWLANMRKLETDLNKNIECIKSFMFLQNSQNELFVIRQNSLTSAIEQLTLRIIELENKK